MFEELKVPVYYADDEAKRLMTQSKRLKKNIVEYFGQEAYGPSGLNRKYLADLVFNDKDRLQALNALVHPEVERHFQQWLMKQRSAYVVQENPLLFEKDKQDQYDAVITVTAPTELRIQRVMTRDGVSRKEVEARMDNQMEQRLKIEKSTYVIENEGNLKDCKNAVLAVHKHILTTIP